MNKEIALISSLVSLFVASCAQQDAPVRTPISEQLAGRVAGEPQTCVPSASSGTLSAVDSGTLAYRSGTVIYLNHLTSPCPTIAPLNTVIVDAQQGRYCRGDRVRSIEPGATIAGPVCILSDWVPYRKP